MRHIKGYIVIVKTFKMKNGIRCKSETILDNKVWKQFDSVCKRIRTIIKNKQEKHNYKVIYDDLTLDRTKRGGSDIFITIMRDKYSVIKKYIVKSMQIAI